MTFIESNKGTVSQNSVVSEDIYHTHTVSIIQFDNKSIKQISNSVTSLTNRIICDAQKQQWHEANHKTWHVEKKSAITLTLCTAVHLCRFNVKWVFFDLYDYYRAFKRRWLRLAFVFVLCYGLCKRLSMRSRFAIHSHAFSSCIVNRMKQQQQQWRRRQQRHQHSHCFGWHCQWNKPRTFVLQASVKC